MSLALVQISPADFQMLYDHLSTFRPRYKNMHMRQVRYVTVTNRPKKRMLLRYLHAMIATPTGEIEGVISGPSAFWDYRLKVSSGLPQIQVRVRRSSPEADARLRDRFVPEVLKRMRQEKETHGDVFPKLTPGEFYLRRCRPGMLSTHANCLTAVSTGVLDQRFVDKLRAWNFALLHP